MTKRERVLSEQAKDYQDAAWAIALLAAWTLWLVW